MYIKRVVTGQYLVWKPATHVPCGLEEVICSFLYLSSKYL